MAQMGRPKVDEPRKNAVMVRFTDKEYQRLVKWAEVYDLTITETVRRGMKKLLQSDP